jgi:tetratricopeptide (TPR) repeat protein
MGWTRFLLDWDWPASAREAERALALDPGNADAYRLSAFVASTQGRFAAAIGFAQRAIAHDPLEIWNYNALNNAYYLAGRLKEAEGPLRTALDLNPTASSLHASFGYLLLVRGEATAALAEIEKEPDEAVRAAVLPIALDALGRRPEADRILADAERRFGSSFAWQFALVHASRKDADGAFRWLERAFAQHDAGLVWFDGEPLLRGIATDLRYDAFRRKLKLVN